MWYNIVTVVMPLIYYRDRKIFDWSVFIEFIFNPFGALEADNCGTSESELYIQKT